MGFFKQGAGVFTGAHPIVDFKLGHGGLLYHLRRAISSDAGQVWRRRPIRKLLHKGVTIAREAVIGLRRDGDVPELDPLVARVIELDA